MASPNFSFTFITPQEFENCCKASAETTTTASLPVDPVTAYKPPHKISAPVFSFVTIFAGILFWHFVLEFCLF
jgi:hypothetical protein